MALFTSSAVAIAIGIDVADTVGTDRQLWAIGTSVLIAAFATMLGSIWLLAASGGPAAPSWLLRLHQYWPFGVLPNLNHTTEE